MLPICPGVVLAGAVWLVFGAPRRSYGLPESLLPLHVSRS
jgi:hypothetical protein